MKEIIVEAKLRKALSYEMQARGEVPSWIDVDQASADLHYYIYPVVRLRAESLVRPLEQYIHEYCRYDNENDLYEVDELVMDNIRADIMDYLNDADSLYDEGLKWFLPRAAEYIARITWFLQFGERNDVYYDLRISET